MVVVVIVVVAEVVVVGGGITGLIIRREFPGDEKDSRGGDRIIGWSGMGEGG